MPSIENYPRTLIATIPQGQSLSGIVDLDGLIVCGFYVNTPWTAANLTFQASYDGINFFNVYTQTGAEYQVTTTPPRFSNISSYDLAGARFLRVRSGTSGAAVVQAGNRDIFIMTRKFST